MDGEKKGARRERLSNGISGYSQYFDYATPTYHKR